MSGLVDQYRYDTISAELKAYPFPHTVVRDLWSSNLLHSCRAEAYHEHETNPRWTKFRNQQEHKDALDFRDLQPGSIALCAMADQMAAMAGPLGRVFDIPGLQYAPDGGGVHWIEPGGYLGVHRDFNQDDQGRWRMINLLIFLEPWEQSWGGDLLLQTPDRQTARAIIPHHNATVAFRCGPQSWHGHPVPHTAPCARLSLAAYFFTEQKPDDGADRSHSTIFR